MAVNSAFARLALSARTPDAARHGGAVVTGSGFPEDGKQRQPARPAAGEQDRDPGWVAEQKKRRLMRVSTVVSILVLASLPVPAQYLETTIPVGVYPTDVLWNHISNKVYVANDYDETVTIISGSDNRVIATVDVRGMPGWRGLCLNTRDNKVYVACGEDNKVAVIDGYGDSLLRTLHISDCPCALTYNALMNKLYVSRQDAGKVAVFDAGTDALLTTVRVGSVTGPNAMLWHPVTNHVFCSMYGEGDSIKTIDCQTDRVVSGLRVGPSCYILVRNAVNNLVYANGGDGLYVLSAGGDSVTAVVPLTTSTAVCQALEQNKLFVCGRHGGNFGTYVVDCESHQIVDSTLPRGGMEFVATWDQVFCLGYTGNARDSVFVFDALTNRLTGWVLVGRVGVGLAWNRTNGRVYVTNSWDNTVSVIKTTHAIAEEPGGPAAARPRCLLARDRIELAEGMDGPLYSATGRQVAVLGSGRNGVGGLSPGTYFLRPRAGPTVRVVITN